MNFKQSLFITALGICLLTNSNNCFGKDKSSISNSSFQQKESNSEEVLLQKISKGFSEVAKKAVPAVVYIETTPNSKSHQKQQGQLDHPFERFHDDFFNKFFNFPQPEKQQPSEIVRGTGFIVSNDGYIVTNNHVVDNASKIMVTLQSGKQVTAEIIGTDSKTDLAVIKINETKLDFLHFGNSDSLEVGDWAIAVGSPFGLQATVTVGVVSAKGRNQLHIADFEDFIQTDAAINPGNSGGPLLNVKGEVIGVNTAIVSGSGGYMGIGFAIPSSMVTRIIEQLVHNGKVTRGFLGVTLQQIDQDLAAYYKLNEAKGALITDVAPNSPAEKAGLKQEDIIIEFNNTPFDNLSSFRNSISLMDPASKVILKIIRDGKIKQFTVTIDAINENPVIANTSIQRLGFQVQDLTPEIAQQLGYSTQTGVVISYVEPGSQAGKAQLQAGNLILTVNRQSTNNVKKFLDVISSLSAKEPLLLMVKQGNAIRFIALQP